MKRCSKCGESKPVSEYWRHTDQQDGLNSVCNNCVRRNRSAEYYAANRDKIKAYRAKYYAANRDKIKASQAKYRAANRGKIKAYQAKYHASNADEKKERKARCRAASANEKKERRARWRAANRDKSAAYGMRRRARKGNGGGKATAKQIRARWELYGETCYICGDAAEETDHVIPLAAGGMNWPANLRPVCRSCNNVKGSQWPYDFAVARIENGLRRDGKDPDLWPGASVSPHLLTSEANPHG